MLKNMQWVKFDIDYLWPRCDTDRRVVVEGACGAKGVDSDNNGADTELRREPHVNPGR